MNSCQAASKRVCILLKQFEAAVSFVEDICVVSQKLQRNTLSGISIFPAWQRVHLSARGGNDSPFSRRPIFVAYDILGAKSVSQVKDEDVGGKITRNKRQAIYSRRLRALETSDVWMSYVILCSYLIFTNKFQNSFPARFDNIFFFFEKEMKRVPRTG